MGDGPANPPRVQASCALSPAPPRVPPVGSTRLEPCMRSCPGACGMGARGCPSQNLAKFLGLGTAPGAATATGGLQGLLPPAGSPHAAHAVPTASRRFQQIETRPRAQQPRRRLEHLNLPFACVALRGRLGGGGSAPAPAGNGLWGGATVCRVLVGFGVPLTVTPVPTLWPALGACGGGEYRGKHWEHK